MFAIILQILLFYITSAHAGYPNPEPCQGLCEGYVHDPSVIVRSDGTYFRFSTNNGTNIATAPNMSGPWTHVGAVLPHGSVINLPGRNDTWAPDCSLHNGTYYLYYAVSVSGSQNSSIGLATSTTMEPASWTDHGSIGIPQNSSYNLIDPNLFQFNTTSPYYLSFGSFWDDIYQVVMSNPPLTSAGSLVHLEQNSTVRPDNLPLGASEGSYQFWWPTNGTDYYYLFFSSGACCNTPPNLVPPGEEYRVMVCRSTNPRSGFVDKHGRSCLTQNAGVQVLASHGEHVYAPGGQGVMYDSTIESVIMYYHYVDPTVGYNYDQFFFGWNKLDFSTGWPVVVS